MKASSTSLHAVVAVFAASITMLALAVGASAAKPPADTVAPIVTIDSPGEGQAVPLGTVSIGFSASDPTPGSGLKSVRCKLSTERRARDCVSPATYSVNTAGNYAVTVTATDNANNVTSVVRNFFVGTDTVGPEVVITSPTGTVASSFTTAFSITDSAPAGVPASGVDAASVTCSIAGPTPFAEEACASGKTYAGLAHGNYSFTVNASDLAGNRSTVVRGFSCCLEDTTSPVINITSPDPGQTYTASTVTATWTITDPVVAGVATSGVNTSSVRCSLTGPTPFAESSCPATGRTFSSLAGGSYTLWVTAQDNAGNGASATRQFNVVTCDCGTGPIINVTAPTSNQSFTATNDVTATWTITDPTVAGQATSGVNTAATTCSLAGPTPYATSGCTTNTKTFSNLANGNYTLTVNAADNAGNTGYATRAFSVAYDSTGPDVSITAPNTGQTLLSNSVTATWTIADVATTGSTASGVNPDATTCSLAGPTPVAQTTCPGDTKSFNGLANGNYTLSVTATDNNGNVGPTATRAFSVGTCSCGDTTPPAIVINAPTSNQSFTATYDVTATWTITDPTVASQATTGVNTAATTCSLAGPTPFAMTGCTTNTKTFNNLANGNYTLTVNAADNADNTGSATRAFSVAYDSTGPIVGITAPTAGQAFMSNSVTATWTISDVATTGSTASGVNPDATTCSLAGPTPFAQTTCPGGTKSFNGLANGNYTLSVTATDNNGNVGPTATRAFSVNICSCDTTPPVIAIVAPTAGQTLTTSTATASWNISDPVPAGTVASGVNAASVRCSLAGPTPFAEASCPVNGRTFTGLANGSYTLTVKAADNAGNMSQATRAFSVVTDCSCQPVINITAPSANQVLNATSVVATWTISGSGSGASGSEIDHSATTCSLAGPTPSAATICADGTKTFSNLANGSYTLTVNARTISGDMGVATRTFSVDVQ